ncbi:unnamed protein product, partial [Choristocarpus tenellus]
MLLHEVGVSFRPRHAGLDFQDDILDHEVLGSKYLGVGWRLSIQGLIPLLVYRGWHKHLGAHGAVFAGALDWTVPNFTIEPHSIGELPTAGHRCKEHFLHNETLIL